MEDGMVKLVPPHSLEAEQSVIGSMIYSQDAIANVVEILKSEDFYQRQYGILYDCIVDLYTHGKPTDLVTIQNEMKTKDVAPEVYSIETLRNLLNMVFTASNAEAYATIVAEKAKLRRMITSMEELTHDCYLEKESASDLMDRTEREIFKILETRTDNPIESAEVITLRAIAEIQAASKAKDGIVGIRTGFRDIDKLTAGFQNSDLLIVAGRPSMGKTAFALNLANNMMSKENKTVAFFSLEQPREQIVKRLLSMESHIDASKLRAGQLSDREWGELGEAAEKVAKAKLIIDDTTGLTATEFLSRARRYKLEYHIDVIFLDYMQMMSAGARSMENRNQEMSLISRILKAAARELKVPVIALSQLSRQSEKRTDHRPTMSDLRESGGIEQDADVIMLLYRDEVYNKDTAEKGVTEVNVAKQRNGPTDTVKLAWIADQLRFADREPDYQNRNGD